MLAQMSQADKLQMVMGGVTTNLTYGYTVPLGAGGWVPANPNLNIPALYLADGGVWGRQRTGAGNRSSVVHCQCRKLGPSRSNEIWHGDWH